MVCDQVVVDAVKEVDADASNAPVGDAVAHTSIKHTQLEINGSSYGSLPTVQSSWWCEAGWHHNTVQLEQLPWQFMCIAPACSCRSMCPGTRWWVMELAVCDSR